MAPRSLLMAATVGSRVMFAGGMAEGGAAGQFHVEAGTVLAGARLRLRGGRAANGGEGWHKHKDEAKAKGIAYEVCKFPWSASGRALSFDRTDGVTKMLIDPESERVLGVGICGANAGELIGEMAVLERLPRSATNTSSFGDTATTAGSDGRGSVAGFA